MRLTLRAAGADGLPSALTTGPSGVAASTFTPGDARPMELRVAGEPMAAPTPRLCGEALETTFAEARPTVTTLVSSEVVRPGSAV